jgi:hypothetical protein
MMPEEHRPPATAAGPLRERIIEVLHRYECDDDPPGHSYVEHLPEDEPPFHPNRIDGLVALFEAEAADASGLRAALNDLASAHHGLSDEPPHQFHASYRDCPDHHCQKALAAVERSATSAKPAGEPDWYEEAVSSGMLPNPPVAGPDAGDIERLAERLLEGQQKQGGRVPVDSIEDARLYAEWLLRPADPEAGDE